MANITKTIVLGYFSTRKQDIAILEIRLRTENY